MAFVKAGRYDEVTLQPRPQGGAVKAVVGADVYVYESDGSTLATLYTDAAKTAGSNPVSTDSNGNLEFFAGPGTYVLKIYVDGDLLRTDTVIVPPDPGEISNAATGIENVLDHGATGDGSTDDLAAIQSAVDAVVAAGGGMVLFPTPDTSFFVDGSIQAANRVALVHLGGRYGPGGSSGVRVLVGNGTDPIVATGSYPGGDSTANRDVVMYGMTMRNNGAPCVDLLTANNFLLVDCVLDSYSLASTDTGTVRVRYSPRGTFRDCTISASGGAWAIDARDNCNGMVIDHCTMTGGSLGGAVFLGMSQSVKIDGNIIETSLVGIVVGGAGTGSGACFGIRVDGNYLENVEQPIIIGETYRVAVGSVADNFISNGSATFTPTFAVKLGRCVGLRADNYVAPKGAEPVYMLMYDAASAGSTPYVENCDLVGTFVNGGTGDLYDVSDFPSTVYLGAVAGKNRLDTVSDGTQPPTGPRVWESGPIDPSQGFTTIVIAPDDTYGGWVDGVDVIDATGTVACTVNVGTFTNLTEIANFDPSSLSYTLGAATQEVDVLWRAGEQMRCRVTAGAGTGSFRLRVRWHGR